MSAPTRSRSGVAERRLVRASFARPNVRQCLRKIQLRSRPFPGRPSISETGASLVQELEPPLAVTRCERSASLESNQMNRQREEFCLSSERTTSREELRNVIPSLSDD